MKLEVCGAQRGWEVLSDAPLGVVAWANCRRADAEKLKHYLHTLSPAFSVLFINGKEVCGIAAPGCFFSPPLECAKLSVSADE